MGSNDIRLECREIDLHQNVEELSRVREDFGVGLEQVGFGGGQSRNLAALGRFKIRVHAFVVGKD